MNGSQFPRVDRMFEIHDEEMLRADANHPMVKAEMEWLRQNTTVPVYMREPYEWANCSVEYPLEAIIKEFGSYLTNTASYMIALALYEGVDELALYGIHMEHMTEYADQRPSCEYFIGLARGRGVPVYIPPESSLLSCRELYGVSSRFTADLAERMKLVNQEHSNQKQVEHVAQLKQAKAEGFVEALGYIKSTYG